MILLAVSIIILRLGITFWKAGCSFNDTEIFSTQTGEQSVMLRE